MPIPLLILCNNFGLGGVEKTAIAFARHFNPAHFEVHLGAYLQGGVREEEVRQSGLPYTIFQQDPAKLADYIRQQGIVALHSHEQREHTVPVVRTARAQGVQCIIQSNVFSLATEVDEEIDRQLFISMTNLYKYNWLYGKAFDFRRRAVLLNPVDFALLDRYRLSTAKRQQFRASLGLQPEHLVIGKLARKTLGKWSDLNLDILPALTKQYPQLRFLVLGLPDSRLRLAQKMGVAKAIIPVEETLDLQQLTGYYQAMDLYVHFSKIGECCSAAIQEAMTFQLPVITNSTPFTRQRYQYVDNGQIEQVIPGQTGYLAHTPRSIVAAVSRLIDQPEERLSMGKAARQLAEQRYSIDQLTLQLEKATVEILAQKNNSTAGQLLSSYQKVSYQPDEPTIQQYMQQYPQLATSDYLPTSLKDQLTRRYHSQIRNRWRAVRDQLAIRQGKETQR